MNSNIIKKGILGFSLVSLLSICAYAESAYAYGNKNQNQNQSQNQAENSLYAPADNDPQTVAFPPQWKEDRFILNMSEEVATDIAQKGTRYKKIMTQTYDMDMLMTPITKPFKGIDKIYITSEYTTTIVFPMRYTVISVSASAPLVLNAFSSNSATIQPARDFVEGNLVVSLSDGDNNKIVNILIERYVPGMITKNVDYDIKYAHDQQFVSTMIIYRDLPKVDDIEILETMFRLYGEKVGKLFDEDCKYETLTYDGIQFFVIRDDKFGEIEYDGINYRIENTYVGCGENAGMHINSTGNILK